MIDAALEVLKNYGVFGFVIFAIVGGGTLYINRITNYFINSIASRDIALKDMSEKFFQTMSDYSKTLQQLYDKHDVMADDIKDIKKKIGAV